jgi:hypothetical protein
MSARNLEIFAAASVFLLCGGLLFEATSYSNGSRYLPFATLAVALGLCIVWLTTLLFRKESMASPTNEGQSPLGASRLLRLTKLVFITVLYVASIQWFGFYTATAFAIPLIAIVIGYRRVWQIGLATLLFLFLVFVVFRLVLAVPLPEELIMRVLEL